MDHRQAVITLQDSVEIFFSAHGVPVSYVEEAGDPYKEEMEQCISLIMQELQRRRISNHHTLAYQSRVGPVQWLQPYTDVTIRYAHHRDSALQPAGDPAGDGKLGSWGLFCGVAAVLVDLHSAHCQLMSSLVCWTSTGRLHAGIQLSRC